MSKTEYVKSGDPPSGEGDSIRVFVRVRPPAFNEGDSERNFCLSVDQPQNAVVMKAKPDPKVFTFDQVADINITQEAVFCSVGKKIIESCVGGYNGTIFAYGQTGSGKTFTMLGPSEGVDNFQHDMRGIIPRSFEYLFNLIKRETEMHGEKKEFLCKCSFLEIYHEQIFDLLDSTAPSLHLRENIKKGVYVSGLTEQAVTSAVEAYQVLSSGWLNRRVASTSMNRESSRSHAVFTLQIESKETRGAIQNVRFSHLNLVDLAGSERQKDTNTVGIRLKEAGSINKSLSTLGNVIMALVTSSNGKTKHVPYRESKLTFLLRDSLGGNAKTQLIACVHPSSKCFGETLSTLQFARRAKMIKNKAIVNEDSLGNIVHLQAEVRKLKEQLAHYQNREIPNKPSEVYITNPENNIQSTGNQSEWKKNFIHAMFFREKSELERRNLQDQINKLEDLINKKEKFLQSTKMIVKFRENYISKLEKAAKSNLPEGFIENAVLQTDLLQELQELKTQVESSPEAKRLALENQRLKGELRKVRGQEVRSEQLTSDPQRVEELEKIFRELLAAKREGGENHMSSMLTTPLTGENNVAVATIEKYKSQVDKLQKEIENLKEKLQDQENASEKALVNAAAELTSYKKAVSELEKVLQARQLKNRIERETLGDMHVQTIKTITTPTKTCYNLRNRTIVSKMPGMSLDLDGSITLEPGEDFFQECQPPQMAEQMAEALTDEIKNLQDNNNSLVHKVEENEGEMIKLRQTLSKLETQNEQLNQILSKERSDWMKREEEILKESASIKEAMQQAMETARISKEESEDHKVMLQSVDRELAALRNKTKEETDSRQKDIALLETKVLNIEMELSNLQKENGKLLEEKNMLQESLDNAQTTVSFHESQIVDLEALLQSERTDLKKIQTELETTYTKLVTEKEKNSQLQSQMQIEGKDKEAEMLKLMEDISNLQAQRSNVQNMFDAQSESLSLLTKELEVTRATVQNQEKQLSENKEGIRTMMTKITELKDGWDSEKERTMSLETELEDSHDKVTTLLQTCDDQRVKIDNLKVQLNEMAEQKEQKISSHNVEVSMLRDELECAMEAYEKLQEELQARQKILEDSQIEADKIAEELNTAKTKELQLREEMEQQRLEYKLKLEELEVNLQPCQLENEEMETLIKNQAEEINKYQQNQARLQQLLDDLESSRQEKYEEIKSLKSLLSDALVFRTESETWSTRCRAVEYELESLKISSDEREKELNASVQKYQCELQNKNQSLLEATDRIEKLTTENESLQLDLINAQLSVDDLQEDVDRLQSLASKDHSDKEELLSQLEMLQAEKNRLLKDMKEVQERLKTIEDDHARMVGHQNHKQKIQFHLALKEENVQLREQVVKLTAELARFKMVRSTDPETVLKENIHSIKRTPGKTHIPSCKTYITPGKVGSHGTKSVTPGRKSQTTPVRKYQTTPSRNNNNLS